MLRTHYSSQIDAKHDGTTVTIAGWVEKIRDVGKIKFLLLRDKYGYVQVMTKKLETDEKIISAISGLTRESVVSIKGVVKANKEAPNGYEIMPKELHIVSRAEAPLPLETEKTIQSELETRLNYRFIDLRRKEIDAIFKVKDVIHRSFIEHLEKEGFILTHVPCIVAASTEGGTNLFPIKYFENEAYLSQSPQLYKQMLMASGLDKVMMVTPVFRAEQHNTTRHLNEAIQMDIETAFVEDEEGALKYMDSVIQYIIKEVATKCKEQLKILGQELTVPQIPFKRMTYTEALDVLKEEGINIPWGEDFTPDAEKMLCKKYDPIIITKWPTDLRAFYSMPEPGNEKICRGYDMLLRGMEVSSGAQRIHDHDQLVREMQRRGMNPKNFTFYLDAFRYGMPPHAGWSFGLERLTMVLCGQKNVREAVLWPRDRTRLTP